MAVDKLVDSTKLDASLTYTADRIRAKTGESADILFDLSNEKGFGDAIDAIETGGYTLEDLFQDYSLPTGDVVYTGTKIVRNGLQGRPFTSFSAPFLTEYPSGVNASTDFGVFAQCKSLVYVDAPLWKTPGDGHNYQCTSLTHFNYPAALYVGAYGFEGCTKLVYAVLPSAYIFYTLAFQGCSSLLALDVGDKVTQTSNLGFQRQNTMKDCVKLKTVIIRKNDYIYALANINNFANTPFASDGSGGTLYVPQALIASYQSATNWSTILGYANNQILPIEGSVYETQYADGTPIT